jgi:hypothetical protein
MKRQTTQEELSQKEALENRKIQSEMNNHVSIPS